MHTDMKSDSKFRGRIPTINHGQNGFTIVEVMLAMTLGLAVILAANSMHNSTKNAFKTSDNVLRMQSNARFAFEFIARDMREAGSLGCRNSRSFTGEDELKKGSTGRFYQINLNDPTNVYANYRPGFELEGYESGAGIPAGTVFNTTDVLPNTDAFTIRGALGRAYPVLAGVAAGDTAVNLDLTGVNSVDLQQNQHAVISSCKQANVFQVTSSKAQIDGGVLNHAAGGAATSNTFPFLFDDQNNQAIVYPPVNIDNSVEVRRVATRTYYLADNTENVPSLFRDVDGGNISPLVEGIENMQIVYGDNTNSVKPSRISPDVYVNANNVQVNPDGGSNFLEVKSIRIAFLMRSAQQIFKTNKAKSYTILGNTVNFNDQFARRVFTATMLLRNRSTGVRN